MSALRLTSLMILCLLAAGCISRTDETLVPVEALAELEQTVPSEATGIDLGGLIPNQPTGFCGAVGLAPIRWITDAVVPMQVWVDSYAELADVPEEATEAVEALLQFARLRLRWSLTGNGERPIWSEAEDAAAVDLAEAALEHCPDLPLVIGLPGTSNLPISWRDLSTEELAQRCADDHDRVASAIGEYATQEGVAPRHQMEMELRLPYFYASDFHGVSMANDGSAVVAAVPGGACG